MKSLGKQLIKNLSIGFALLLIILTVLLFSGFITEYYSSLFAIIFVNTLIAATLFFFLHIREMSEKERQDSKMIEFVSYMFLLSLVILVVNQFLQRDIITNFQWYIVIISIALGFLSFYAKHDSVERELDAEKAAETKAENERRTEFNDKFPMIARIPVLRNVVRWMYSEGWWYSGGLILIVVVGFVLRINRLGEASFWWDELLHISAAEKINQSWIPVFGSGEVYLRSFPVTYLVYFIGRYIQIDEFYARLPIATISLAIIIIGYFITKDLCNKKTALFASLTLSLFVPIIVISQELRYYSLLSIYLLLFSWILLNCDRIRLKESMALIFLIFLGLNSSLIFLAIGVFSGLGYLFWQDRKVINIITNLKKNKRYSIPALTILFIYSLFKFFEIVNKGYFNKGFIFKISTTYFTFLLPVIQLFAGIGLVFGLILNRKELKVLFLPSFFVLLTLSLVNTRFGDSLRYVTFMIPIMIILLAYGVHMVGKISGKKIYFSLIVLIITACLIQLYEYNQGSKFIETKQELTWTRPDYKIWAKVSFPENATVLSNVPHIAKFYVGKIDYSLDITDQNASDKFYREVNLKSLDSLKYRCAIIFADYKSEYMWDNEIKREISISYHLVNESKNTKVYLSNYCLGNFE